MLCSAAAILIWYARFAGIVTGDARGFGVRSQGEEMPPTVEPADGP